MSDLRKLAEHTVDLDLLPETPLVLDVGCRGFAFDHEILKLRPKAHIVALDPDPKIDYPQGRFVDSIEFYKCALVGKPVPFVFYLDKGGEANCVVDGGNHRAIAVPSVSITDLVHGNCDLVKLDCEMSEFEILENWPGPIATQISVEFHDYNNWQKWDDAYFERLFAGPLKDYRVVQHERFGIGNNDMGHWDSLLVLR